MIRNSTGSPSASAGNSPPATKSWHSHVAPSSWTPPMWLRRVRLIRSTWMHPATPPCPTSSPGLSSDTFFRPHPAGLHPPAQNISPDFLSAIREYSPPFSSTIYKRHAVLWHAFYIVETLFISIPFIHYNLAYAYYCIRQKNKKPIHIVMSICTGLKNIF